MNNKAPTLRTVMTPFPYFVAPDDTLIQAQEMMGAHAIRHLPVQQQQSVVGLISERDIQVTIAARPDTNTFSQLQVCDVCTQDPYVVSMDEALADVLDAMAARHIGSVVVTRHGKLAGVFTSTDACQAFAALLRASEPQENDPEAA